MLKRAFDLVFSLLALILLSPVLLAVGLALRLDSPGPVFFRQVRVGRHGHEFKIYKFRTMRPATAEDDLQITVAMDPRITRIGRFLRRYKVDEFPQFINVLLGDMSVVGPRPEVPCYVALYPADIRSAVLSVRPGITDLGSLEYRDENQLLAASKDPEYTYTNEIMPTKLAHYVRYVKERSFCGDLAIIVRSLSTVFHTR